MPGMASMITITPMPKSSSSAPGSSPPWNMRVMKRRRRQPKGVREKVRQWFLRYSFITSAPASSGDNYVDDFVCGLCDIFFLDELQEYSFQRRCSDAFADFTGGAVRYDLSFSENDQVGADFFHDFEDMRAIEDGFAAGAQGLNEIFDDESGSDVEAGKRLVQDEQIGIVHESGDEKDALAHALGIRSERNVAMRPQGEELEEGIDSGVRARSGHGAQRCDHVEIFLAGEIGIEIGFLGNVAEALAVGDEVFVDILAVVSDFAVGGLEQAGEHFHRGAFSGTVRAQIAEYLARGEGEGYVLDGGNGAIVFVESLGCEHFGPSLLASGHDTAGVCGQWFDTGKVVGVPGSVLFVKARRKASSMGLLVLGPRRSDAGHAGVGDELAHVLVGVNDDAQIHAVDGGVAIGDVDFALEVFGGDGGVGFLHGFEGALEPADDIRFGGDALFHFYLELDGHFGSGGAE